jgi:hypothetical protein
MDYPKVKGWYVRVPAKPEGHQAKLFSDGIYDGRDAALKAAMKWRNGLIRFRRPTSLSTPRRHFKLNTSGFVGVAQIVRNGVFCGWKAFWNETARKQKFRKFMFSDHDEEEAFILAICCRKQNVSRIRERIRRQVRDEEDISVSA